MNPIDFRAFIIEKRMEELVRAGYETYFDLLPFFSGFHREGLSKDHYKKEYDYRIASGSRLKDFCTRHNISIKKMKERISSGSYSNFFPKAVRLIRSYEKYKIRYSPTKLLRDLGGLGIKWIRYDPYGIIYRKFNMTFEQLRIFS